MRKSIDFEDLKFKIHHYISTLPESELERLQNYINETSIYYFSSLADNFQE